jgi:hypothetical protein
LLWLPKINDNQHQLFNQYTKMDDEEVCLFLRASDFAQQCGRGRRPNFFHINKFRMIPPPPLKDIDGPTWRRLGKRTASAKLVGRKHRVRTSIVFVPWLILFLLGDAYSETEWFIASFVVCSVLLVASIMWSCRKGEEASLHAEKNAVLNMKGAFARHGYDIDYVSVPNCGVSWCPSCTFVRFRRNGCHRKNVAATNNKNGEEDTPSFDPDCWIPLEGTWRRMQSSKDGGDEGCPDWVYRLVSDRIDVNGTSNVNTFSFVRRRQSYFLGGCFTKRTLEGGKAQGNTLILQENDQGIDPSVLKEKIEQVHDEELKGLLNLGLEEAKAAMTFLPMSVADCASSNPTATFYRNKTGDSVWKIEGSSLTMFSDFDEDCLTNTTIFCDRSQVESREMTWVQYERVHDNYDYGTLSREPGWGFAEDVRNSERDSSAELIVDDDALRTLKKRLSFTAALQLPALIILFFASTTAPEVPAAFRVLLFVTALCGVPNFGYTWLTSDVFGEVPACGILWSALYCTGLFISDICLLATWTDWTSHWLPPFVWSVTFYWSAFSAAAFCNLYWSLKLRRALIENRRAFHVRFNNDSSIV